MKSRLAMHYRIDSPTITYLVISHSHRCTDLFHVKKYRQTSQQADDALWRCLKVQRALKIVAEGDGGCALGRWRGGQLCGQPTAQQPAAGEKKLSHT